MTTTRFFQNIVLTGIDLEAYGIEATTNSEKVQEVYKVFLSEKGREIKRQGEFNAFTDWLQGLPTVLEVPFMYHEQIEMAKEAGFLNDNSINRKVDKFIQDFFVNCTTAFFALKNKS